MKENECIGKVIRLPDRPEARGVTVRFDLEHRKVAIAASLVSVLLVVTFANKSLDSWRLNDSAQGRGIANIESPSLNPATVRWEHRLAKSLAQEGRRDLAGIGQKPSLMEELRFGLLEGSYAVELNQGQVNKIEFLSQERRPQPKSVKNHMAFFEKFAPLFGVNFAQIVKVEEKIIADNIRMVFELRNAQNQRLAEVQFLNDSYGRLLSMNLVK